MGHERPNAGFFLTPDFGSRGTTKSEPLHEMALMELGRAFVGSSILTFDGGGPQRARHFSTYKTHLVNGSHRGSCARMFEKSQIVPQGPATQGTLKKIFGPPSLEPSGPLREPIWPFVGSLLALCGVALWPFVEP